ncbi:MAG TPA: type I DNA topoisomerase [Candidatus Paceibacterota bacterium]
MKLIIVESPTKAKTIAQFFKGDYRVESSYGHVRDLPRSKLGVDVEHDFQPQYVIPRKTTKTVNNLKKLAKKAKEVILATDEDREGEAIAWHLAQALNLHPEKEDVKRIVFHEITKTALEHALHSPRKIDQDLVDAQQGRRILDRLVGYKLSPFLWQKIAKGLSAGRVQSVALRLIVEREEEIEKFVPTEYWQLEALLKKQSGDPQSIEARLVKINDTTLDQLDLKNQVMVEEIVKTIGKSEFQIIHRETKEVNKNPLPPFITSTLQQEAAKRLGFSAKKTMLMAQRLYEQGLITYMRTDSVNLSQEALTTAKSWLTANLGERYASQAPRAFKSKSRLAQEAHEAIRPTNITHTPDNTPISEKGEKVLYGLIWQRFVASQMPQAIFNTTQVDIRAAQYTFRASGNILVFDGFLKIWEQKFQEKTLPQLSENEILSLIELKPSQHFTEPPPRFNEASLIKTLEEFGIGRPSTYAPTISIIQERNYVEKREARLYPTDMGRLVNKVLIENFPEVVDIDFTAKMEESLDNIAEHKERWQDVIKQFYVPFEKNLLQKTAEVIKAKPPVEITNILCEKCGKPMAVKMSRFGKFLACTGFPECRNTKSLAPKESPKPTGMHCPKCAEGDVIERRVSRGRARGKSFWGCSRYPKCDYASWTNPTLPPTDAKNSSTGPTPEK